MRLTQRNMTYIPTSIQRGSPRDRPPPDKDHAAAGSFTIEYFPGSGSCSGRASRGARPQDITGTPRAHGMRVTGRGDRPLRGGAPAPRTKCDTSRKRVLPASAVCASLPSPRGAGGRNERKEEGISMTVHTPIEKLDPADRSEEHTSELQSLMRISYAVFCLKKKNLTRKITKIIYEHTS